jgi:surface protein
MYPNARYSYQVAQWGSGFRFGNAGGYFYGCTYLTLTATDAPDLTGTAYMWGTFNGAAALNSDLSSWNMASVTYIGAMFAHAVAFNGDVSSWNVAKITDMHSVFQNTPSFNGNLTAWSVSSVTNCVGFCSGGSISICGVPIFPACTSGCTGGRTIQTLSGSSACSCPAGEVGTPGTDTFCGTCSLELAQK